MSLAVTSASFLAGSPSSSVITTSLIVATIVPLIVAPLASSAIVRLLLSLAVAHDDLHVLATTDSLTGVANRRRFFDEAGRLCDEPRPHSVLLVGMVDIDRFKRLNDQHGHATGDAALVTLAGRLQHAAGGYGVVGRLGGDEFGLFLAVPEDSLPIVTHAIHAACSSIEIEPGRPIGASVGLRTFHVVESVDSAMRLADAALYAAKATPPRSALPVESAVPLDQ